MPEATQEKYLKRISNKLAVSLAFTDTNECVVGFHNLLKGPVVINPKTKSPEPGWFNSIFGSLQPEDENANLVDSKDFTETTNIFLGYIQLCGYVVCNYKHLLNDTSSLGAGTIGAGNDTDNLSGRDREEEDSSVESSQLVKEIQMDTIKQLWSNKDYLSHYNNDHIDDDLQKDGWNEDLSASEVLDTTEFTTQSLKDRMIIGGKIGGISDLVHNTKPGEVGQEISIDKYKRYGIQDLVFGFNTLPEPKGVSKVSANGGTLIRELADSILPFYSTSQSLLFSEMKLDSGQAKTFKVKFQTPEGLPPSYNTRLTGATGDQGLVSIRYALTVGVLELEQTTLETRTAYFPFEVRQKYVEEYYTPEYFKRTIIDAKWNVTIDDEDKQQKDIHNGTHANGKLDNEISRNIDKQSFLQDLSNLIQSDLYNMPKVSSTERRKSSLSIHGAARNDGLVSQLKKCSKTQYQIRLNNQQLCTISITRPYFYVGDDINFIIDTTPEIDTGEHPTSRIVGGLVYIEAHEIFHCRKGSSLQVEKDYTHQYKVSPTIKINNFASSMSQLKSQSSKSVIHGSLNVPSHLTPQFQSSRFVDLEYNIVFKFNLNEFIKESTILIPVPGDEGALALISDADQQKSTEKIFQSFKNYRIDNNSGGEFHFKLPIVIL